jgi:hypothetical protein
VVDSKTYSNLTDVYVYLFGPEGFLDGWFVPDGDKEYWSQGVLLPGVYRVMGGGIASLRTGSEDDFGFASYTYWLSLPEPSTLMLLLIASMIVNAKRLF